MTALYDIELYDLVQHYASLGHHRTATPCDVATIDWLTQLIEARY